MSGFTTDSSQIDALANALMEKAEERQIIQNIFVYKNVINLKKEKNNLEVLLLETNIPLFWETAKKISRLNELFMRIYAILGSSFPRTFQINIGFTYGIMREHLDRPTTYSLFIGHNNRSNMFSPIYKIKIFLEDINDIRTFCEKLFNETDFDDIAERLWIATVSTTTQAKIWKIYMMVLSVLI